MDCPLDKPPRNLTVLMLWRYIRELERRMPVSTKLDANEVYVAIIDDLQNGL